MTLKKWIAAMLAVCILATGVVYAAGGGTSSDPIATLSYIEKKFIPRINEAGDAAVKAAEPTMKALVDDARIRLDSIASAEVTTTVESLAAAVVYEGVMHALDDGLWFDAATPTRIALSDGEQLYAAFGSEIQLMSGSATFGGERAGGAVCVSTSVVNYSGIRLAVGARYIVYDETRPVGVIASGNATVMVVGRYQVVPKVETRHTDAALALNALGLMRGTTKGFEMERGATRLEALIMFLRIIGEEDAALAYKGSQPFTDLPAWGNGTPAKYVGYAYSKGYTKGISDTLFGANDPVTLEMYATFLLRALGYSEAKGDFNWATAPADAVRLGLVSEYERESAARRPFCRDTMAYLSWRALDAKDVDGKLLRTRLIKAGVFTADDYVGAVDAGVRTLGK